TAQDLVQCRRVVADEVGRSIGNDASTADEVRVQTLNSGGVAFASCGGGRDHVLSIGACPTCGSRIGESGSATRVARFYRARCTTGGSRLQCGRTCSRVLERSAWTFSAPMCAGISTRSVLASLIFRG